MKVDFYATFIYISQMSANVKVIQEIMGHSDISTTMNIYNHATEDKKKEAINNLNGKIKIS